MSYDARIILGGQAPDIMNALANSNVAAQQRIGFDRENAMNRMLKEQGAGIVAGDQNALAALAGYDPMAALGVQESRLGMDQTRLGMDATRQQMSALDAETKRAAEEYARGLSAEQRAAEAAELEAGVKQALMAPNAQAFDAMMTQMGRPELVGQFDNRQMLAGQFMSVAEILKMQQGPETGDRYKVVGGSLFDLQAEGGPAAVGTGAMQERVVRDADGNVTYAEGGPGTVAALGDPDTRKGQVFDEIKASAESARAAVTGLRALKEAEAALSGPAGAITGFAADQRLSAAKLGALMGITDPAVIENTETFRSAIAPQVAAMLKATVGSAQISNSDREFAEKAAGGSIALDESTIRRLLGIMEKAALATVESHNRRLDAVYPEGTGADRERGLFSVRLPDAPAAPPKSAKDMSDDEYLQSLGLE